MTVTTLFKHGREPKAIGYRKRLRVFSKLEADGFKLEPHKAADARNIDEYLFNPEFGEQFRQSAQYYMSQFDKGSDNSGYVRESAPDGVLSWVSNDDHRFFFWAFFYWSQVLGNNIPLSNNNYIKPKDKMILWLDSLYQFQEQKRQLETHIRDLWYQNKKIDKALSSEKSKEEGFWSFFWEKTISEFWGYDDYQRVLAFYPEFDKPFDEEQCYYSSVLLYDVSSTSLSAKLRLINDIKKRWSNNKRQKIQTNIYLLPETREKLEKVADAYGLRKSELVARWIWESYKDLE